MICKKEQCRASKISDYVYVIVSADQNIRFVHLMTNNRKSMQQISMFVYEEKTNFAND